MTTLWKAPNVSQIPLFGYCAFLALFLIAKNKYARECNTYGHDWYQEPRVHQTYLQSKAALFSLTPRCKDSDLGPAIGNRLKQVVLTNHKANLNIKIIAFCRILSHFSFFWSKYDIYLLFLQITSKRARCLTLTK